MQPWTISSPPSLSAIVDSEWEDDRDDIGDSALHDAFLRRQRHNASLTATIDQNIHRFVKDDDATYERVKEELLTSWENIRLIIQQRQKQAQKSCCHFVFYFGGHGASDRFCLSQNTELYHKEMAELILNH